MSFRPSTLLAAALSGAALVAAHGHVNHIIANGVQYQGYDVTSFPYMASPPKVVGWTATNTDNGFVGPEFFASGDIICHKGATPGGGHATVAAGSSISIQWDTWPESHHGPVIDYLAACNGNCETVDKTSLNFFKIDSAGLVSGGAPGVWASDTLIANNNSWLVQIPATLKPGNYVLRHEIIALHSAGQTNGAQAYPQCFNLAVTGSGTVVPSGTPGTALYKAADAGILFNLYTSPLAYTVPGPTLIAGAASSVAQSVSKATVASSATVPGAAAPAPATTTAAAAVPTTTSIKTTTSTSAAVVVPATTLITSTKAATTTTAVAVVPTTTTAASAPGTVKVQSLYGQCGGINWTGATACVAGSTCKLWNPYYAQCVSA
ncbi:glycosyl hydrolase family 61-domain-containing protein [Cercophora scortea]|uniref:lytic cellulose monooxygenase (C4-dehydrogenating) n=1 Tax=Cercophora scortea TaxID=314031 RepID=A0AAE0MEM4_9PEZI|nr:glycosyl hydrolase family 61-domain-containing protein [Cercophora scortea]